jgi:hypothetical protein
MSFKGMWLNEYGSAMNLSHDDDGRVFGSYRSTTGSTGTFYVLGYADPREYGAARGRSVSLSIFWRSIGDDPADPSWHWVSGLGGQLLEERGDETTILLLHDMVATAAFPGQADVGRHLDKLVFTQKSDARVAAIASARDIIASAPSAGLPCALSGTWVDESDPSTRLLPKLLDSRFGFAEASLEVGGKACAAIGFIDPFAEAEGCRLQAISLSGLIDREKGETITLSGSLDRSERVATLTVFRNSGTTHELRYTQTTVDQFRLVPDIHAYGKR